jgi:hypothetical protein
MGSCAADQVKVIPWVEYGVAATFVGALGGKVYTVDTATVEVARDVFPAISNA